eukprot:TRINITY_DN109_c0_g2_i2.p1 TRINITY_DN109_c0_g2~~TRINITY_DN109_c0_g2_i2.p1  ORF type:complete len:116 (+),score=7.24 TRINITY_DN109_c0_g2_i2:24-350(+)
MFAFVFVALFALSSAKIFYEEDFSNDDSLDKWVQSTHRPASERGKVGLSAGKYFTNEEEEKGMREGDLHEPNLVKDSRPNKMRDFITCLLSLTKNSLTRTIHLFFNIL